MKTRKVGELTWADGETGIKAFNWDAEPSGLSEKMVVHVLSTNSTGTYTHGLYGWVDPARPLPGLGLATPVSGNRIYVDIPIMPYLTVSMDMSVAPTGSKTVEVWVVE